MKNRTELAKYFGRLGFTKGAEIGVCFGYYSNILCQNIPGLKLIAIDNWNNPKNSRREISRKISGEEETRKLLSPYKATIIKKDSIDAAKDVPDESLDFVFIDADHSYKSVKKDIEVWSKKVKVGGIIAGHDYYVFPSSGNRGVVDAVDEYTQKNGCKLLTTSWDKNNPVRDDRQPSWYFFKSPPPNALEYILKKYDLRLSDKIEIPNAGRNNLAALLSELDFKTGAEIGVQRGLYSEVLCKNNPQMKIYGVDPWESRKNSQANPPDCRTQNSSSQETCDRYYEETLKRTGKYPKYKILKEYSVDAAKKFADESLDFVYIDANHEPEFVLKDIAVWSKKVKVGGIIAGHDYYNTSPSSKVQLHVKDAVDKYVRTGVSPLIIWGLNKETPGIYRDKWRSWMWVKT